MGGLVGREDQEVGFGGGGDMGREDIRRGFVELFFEIKHFPAVIFFGCEEFVKFGGPYFDWEIELRLICEEKVDFADN